MEANLRNILILISAIAIVAIFIHGLWTIRKNKNPYKLKTGKESYEPGDQEESVDSNGFDRFGVGQVKVSSQANQNNNTNEHLQGDNDSENLEVTQKIEPKISINTGSEEQKDPLIDTLSFNATTHDEHITLGNSAVKDNLEGNQNKEEFSLSSVDVSEPSSILSQTSEMSLTQTIVLDKNGIKEELGKLREEHLRKNVYQEPVSRAKPRRISKSVTRKISKEELKRNQMEIDFDNSPAGNEEEVAVNNTSTLAPNSVSKTNSSVANSQDKQINQEQLVIALSVVMPQGQQMMGAALLPMLLTLGFKFGDLNIFHRHQDNAGNGDARFSLVNMMNPGTFDLDAMETFATPGVSLFMALPSKGDAFEDFDLMLSAAKHIAQAFNAQVIDDKRNVMTKQTEQHYVSKIREFDRQHRLAIAE
ncbi:MAG: cell division protein ZipA [Colwellia sp.]